MPDAIYAHPRLAPIYDAFDGDRDDLDFYVDLADALGARTVVDVGCGTGCLAVRLAATGRSVVALDPAEASLGAAKLKEGADTVRWLHGGATVLPALGADLAVMTGNVAQAIATDREWARTLEAIARALRPDGHLAFETRRPVLRAWLEWARQSGPVTVDVPGIGKVGRRLEVTAVRLPYISLRYTYRFAADAAVVTSDSTLRFRSREEVESDLLAHGYRVLDVRDVPDRPGQEYVFIAERPI